MGAVASLEAGWGDPSVMFQLSALLIRQATDQANALISGAAALQPPTINPAFPAVAASPAPVTVSRPSLLPVTWTTPNAPAPFSGGLDVIVPEPFSGAAPTLTFSTPPGGYSGAVPASPALNLNFSYPSVSVTLPTPPTQLSVETVAFAPLVIPSFDVTVPALVLTAPNIVSYVERAFYTSTTLSAVQSRLQSALTDDTDIGLTAATQQALWDAARERELRQQAAAIADLDRMETLGYAFPPGVFVDARIKIQTETNSTLAGLSREIMVKQAELRLENVTKAREQAITLEGRLVEYYNQINQRSFENARRLTENAITIYNAEVQTYTARLEAYKTQALVYDTQIKGIAAYVEQLKARIEFEHTKAEMQTREQFIRNGVVDIDVAKFLFEKHLDEIEEDEIEEYNKDFAGKMSALLEGWKKTKPYLFNRVEVPATTGPGGGTPKPPPAGSSLGAAADGGKVDCSKMTPEEFQQYLAKQGIGDSAAAADMRGVRAASNR